TRKGFNNPLSSEGEGGSRNLSDLLVAVGLKPVSRRIGGDRPQSLSGLLGAPTILPSPIGLVNLTRLEVDRNPVRIGDGHPPAAIVEQRSGTVGKVDGGGVRATFVSGHGVDHSLAPFPFRGVSSGTATNAVRRKSRLLLTLLAGSQFV